MMNDGPAQASPHDLRRHAVSKAIRDALYRQRQNDSNVDTAVGLKMYTEDGYVEVDVDMLAREAMRAAPDSITDDQKIGAIYAEAEKDELLRLQCFDRVMAFYDNRTESTSFGALGPTPDMIAHKLVAAAREIYAYVKGAEPVNDQSFVRASREATAAEKSFGMSKVELEIFDMGGKAIKDESGRVVSVLWPDAPAKPASLHREPED